MMPPRALQLANLRAYPRHGRIYISRHLEASELCRTDSAVLDFRRGCAEKASHLPALAEYSGLSALKVRIRPAMGLLEALR